MTPRIGKPIEINALWHNGLCVLAQLAEATGQPLDAAFYREHAQAAACGFAASSSPSAAFASMSSTVPMARCQPAAEPNLRGLAAALRALNDQARSVVDTCAAALYTRARAAAWPKASPPTSVATRQCSQP